MPNLLKCFRRFRRSRKTVSGPVREQSLVLYVGASRPTDVKIENDVEEPGCCMSHAWRRFQYFCDCMTDSMFVTALIYLNRLPAHRRPFY